MNSSAMFQRLWNPNVATVLVLIALSGPALWSVWLITPSIERHPGTAHTPTIRYILTDPEREDGLWSPLLFSLPTPYGFSRTVKMAALDTRGIPVAPIPAPPLLTFNQAFTGATIHRDKHALSEPCLRAALLPYRPAPELPAIPRTIPDGGPVWRPHPMLAKQGFSPPENWIAQLPETPAPWSVAAVVHLDGKGRVRHVFLTEPHQDRELNAAIVNILRQGRAQADKYPVSGMVTIAWP